MAWPTGSYVRGVVDGREGQRHAHRIVRFVPESHRLPQDDQTEAQALAAHVRTCVQQDRSGRHHHVGAVEANHVLHGLDVGGPHSAGPQQQCTGAIDHLLPVPRRHAELDRLP